MSGQSESMASYLQQAQTASPQQSPQQMYMTQQFKDYGGTVVVGEKPSGHC